MFADTAWALRRIELRKCDAHDDQLRRVSRRVSELKAQPHPNSAVHPTSVPAEPESCCVCVDQTSAFVPIQDDNADKVESPHSLLALRVHRNDSFRFGVRTLQTDGSRCR